MAVIEFTAYSSEADCLRTNQYISDGHGSPSAARSNRYIADGHGCTTQCLGHNCPSDPILATAVMESLRWNYERQHCINKNRKKGCVTHIQLYISPTEEDKVPPEERTEMTRELIERTDLRDFSSIYIPHDNTSVGHCHVSLCPYSLDGSHKLCMNNKLLYDLRRKMDHICVEHGYSIVECPELWGDKEYRDWFLQIKAEGKITIHPPKEQDLPYLRGKKKRTRNYLQSKQRQAKEKEERETYFKEITKGCCEANEDLFYTSPWLYNPSDPSQPLRIRKITLNGKYRNEMDLRASSLGAWAYHCKNTLGKKAIPGTEGLHSRVNTIYKRAYEAKNLFETLDIRTQEEFINHICECGQDIGTLKRNIKKQENILQKLRPQVDAVERWENEQDKEAFAYLAEHHCNTLEQINTLKKNHTRALAYKERYTFLLEERSKEYRNLKQAEKVLDPTFSEEAWESYLEKLFSKNKIMKAKRITADELEYHIYELAELLRIPDDVINSYLIDISDYAERLRRDEERREAYLEYREAIFSAREMAKKGYDQYQQEMAAVHDLWDLRRKLAGFGFLGFLLSLIVELWAEMKQDISRCKFEQARWAALAEQIYANIMYKKDEQFIPYHPEIVQYVSKEQQEKAARIQRIVNEIVDHRRQNSKEACIIYSSTVNKKKYIDLNR